MPSNGKELTYFGYTRDETRESITADFTRRFGYPPVAIFEANGGDWWAGPVEIEYALENLDATSEVI